MEKVKQILEKISYLIIVILGYVLFDRNRKLQQAETDLAREKTNGEIKSNEAERQIAKNNADQLVDEYDRSKR
jgi:ABC-type nickel/cobalt efflux system permease component RcnA